MKVIETEIPGVLIIDTDVFVGKHWVYRTLKVWTITSLG